MKPEILQTIFIYAAAFFQVIAIIFGLLAHNYSSKADLAKKDVKIEKIKQNFPPNTLLIFNNDLIVQNTINISNQSNVSRKETSVILDVRTLSATYSIKESHNVLAIADLGSGDLIISFNQDFPNDNYYVDITGDKDTKIKKIIKTKGSIRIHFEERDLETLQVRCWG